jgi:drug/metabolite transporter (DMT)-like permease
VSVPAAYLGVIVIWTTTPLAIKWSGEGAGFLVGAGARMAIGALVALILLRLLGQRLYWHRTALLTYGAGVVAVFGAMGSVYWGAQYIPSGLIAVVFGLVPIFTGVLASLVLGERSLTPARVTGMLLGLAGLAMVFAAEVSLGPGAALGIGAVLLSALLHSLSAVLIKRVDSGLPALSVTTGSLLLATPLYALAWLAGGAELPDALPARSVAAIAYLGVVGSVLGFVLYYYALSRLPASRIALITLITPVTALLLGQWLNGESVPPRVWAGTGIIAGGLAVYLWGGPAFRQLRRAVVTGGWLRRTAPSLLTDAADNRGRAPEERMDAEKGKRLSVP